MILAESFKKEWIYSHRVKAGFERINPAIAEKMIYALALVEALAGTKLDFVFKGGTSLILLLPGPGRFSIDIDIITIATREDVEASLQSICIGKPFDSFRLNERRSYKPGIPKAHYELVYISPLSGKEDHILLDILFDSHPYPVLVKTPIVTDWLQTHGSSVMVNMPSHESIAGDKLTAFAPNTTGIPYNRGKELEIVKQLFDLGRLYDGIRDMSVTGNSFDSTVVKESIYRGGHLTREDVIQDIIHTGLLIAKREKNNGEPHASNFKEIQKGLLQFKAYQISSFFRIEEAIVASSKSALMAARIKTGESGPSELFISGRNKQDYLILHPDYSFLNKLSTEALFYWHKVLKTLKWI
jgi:hypothetical protein